METLKTFSPILTFFPEIAGTDHEDTFSQALEPNSKEQLSYLKTIRSSHLHQNDNRHLFEQRYLTYSNDRDSIPSTVHYLHAHSQIINLKDRFIKQEESMDAYYESIKSFLQIFTFSEQTGYIILDINSPLQTLGIGKLMCLRWHPKAKEGQFEDRVQSALVSLGIRDSDQATPQPMNVLEAALHEAYRHAYPAGYYYVKYHLLKASLGKERLSLEDLKSIVEALNFLAMWIHLHDPRIRNKIMQILEQALPNIISDLELYYTSSHAQEPFDNIIHAIYKQHSIFNENIELPFESSGESLSANKLKGALMLILTHHKKWHALSSENLEFNIKSAVADFILKIVDCENQGTQFHLLKSVPKGTFQELIALQNLARMVYQKHYDGDAKTHQAFACAQVYIQQLIDKANSLFFTHPNKDTWPEYAREAYGWALKEVQAWYKEYPMASSIDNKHSRFMSVEVMGMYN